MERNYCVYIKTGSRKKKKDLVQGFNPQWRELFDDVAVM